jgi:hypothetical protein
MLAVAAEVLNKDHLANRRQEVVLVAEAVFHQHPHLPLQLQQTVVLAVVEEFKVLLAQLHLKVVMVLLVLLLLNIQLIQ